MSALNKFEPVRKGFLFQLSSGAAPCGAGTGVSGSVEEAVGKYKAGEFKPIEDPTVGSHYGIKKQ